MAVKYEISAASGKYTDKDGQEKTRYTKMGVILTTKTGGFALKIESIPVGWDGWAYLNEPKPKDQPRQAHGTADFNDDIPFG